MAYWITLKMGKVRQGFQAADAQEALDVLVAKKSEGYEEVRIIHPDGYEVSGFALEVAIREKASGTDALISPSEPPAELKPDGAAPRRVRLS